MAETILRTFIAVPLPEPVKAHLKQAQDRLQAAVGGSGVRWVAPEGLHLTLKFLGQTQAHEVPAITEALSQAAAGATPSTLRLSRLGAFPSARRPRVLWVGTTEEVAPLTAFYRQVEERLAALHFPREGRPFAPHITLGRVRDGAPPQVHHRLEEALVDNDTLGEVPPAPVTEVVLYRSTLTPAGAVYSPLVVATLSGDGFERGTPSREQ